MADLAAKVPLRVRTVVLLLTQGAMVALAYFLAFNLRFDFSVPDWAVRDMTRSAPWYVALHLGSLWLNGVFHGLWRYFSVWDFVGLLRAVAFGSLVFFLVDLNTGGRFVCPRSVHLVSFGITLAGLAGMRLMSRLVREHTTAWEGVGDERPRRVVLIGAGDAGFILAREIKEKHRDSIHLAGFVDDAPDKKGCRVLGVPILGGVKDLPALQPRHRFDEAVIAIPSAGGRTVRHIQDICRRAGIPAKITPGLSCIIEGTVNSTQIRDVSVEDLLRREPVMLEGDGVERLLKGRAVLVSGAGGSIGSELTRQIAKYGPSRIVLLEQGETPLYEIDREIRTRYPGVEVVPVLASITHRRRVAAALAENEVATVFHAAAYKHVPLLESNPCTGVWNNVLGTRVLAEESRDHGVETFVMVSTDKAVHPTSVMGASKRVCELIVMALGGQAARPKHVTVRFGNVLGSNGSVVPLFQRQIEAGGPVTVTDERATRYFMTIPEASHLVLQAAALGESHEVFILDMGEPVKVVDLARDLIELAGRRVGQDIQIEYIGLRPGEKLHEELLLAEEATDETRHPSILKGRIVSRDPAELFPMVEGLLEAAEAGDVEAVRARLEEIVPECREPDTPGEAAKPVGEGGPEVATPVAAGGPGDLVLEST